MKCVAAKLTEKHNTKERTGVLLLILMLWAFMLFGLHASNNFMIKLLVRRVRVWVDFRITLPFTPYLDTRGAAKFVL